MSDTESIRELVSSGSFGVVIDFLFVFSSLLSFFSINLFMGIGLGISEVLVVILLLWGSKFMREVFRDVRKTRGEVFQVLANCLGGVSEGYFEKQKSYIIKRCEKTFDRFLSAILSSNVWDASYYAIAESLYPILLVLLAIIFPYSGITQVAMIFVLIDLVQRSISPIKEIAGKITNIQRAMTGVQRLIQFNEQLTNESQFLDERPKRDDLSEVNLKIEQFSYQTTKELESGFSLEKINLTIKKGELTALVGFSGSGKSTILKILSGLIVAEQSLIELKYSNQTNELIKINPQNLLHFKKYVGLISQDSHIFTDSLYFNLSLGTRTQEECQNFWEYSCKEIEYLREWDLKIENLIIPATLSAGQIQLLAGLRACFLKKPLVLFDEISSSLDSKIELALRNLIRFIQRDSLTLIVAHRVETIQTAENIYVLSSGKITHHGEHKYLMSASEIYRDFHNHLSP